MNPFEFYNPTRIIFGKGVVATKLPSLISDAARVLLVYGGGSIKQNGVYQQVMSALSSKKVFEFSGVPANPTYEVLMKAVELVKREKIDYLLAVGGGSVIDGTKFIAAASYYEGDDPWEILSNRAPVKKAIPFGCVLTLPATGSEMNSGSVVTKEQTQDKLFFMSPLCFPQFSLLDPDYTLSLSERQMGNGVVDAFVHVVEQYLTYPVNSPIQDRFAEGLLSSLIEEGQKLMKQPQDLGVRGNIMWAATMALNGLIGAGVVHDWSTHMIGHELTALFHIDHARTLAIVLPGNLRLRKDEKTQKLLQYARRVWGVSSSIADETAIDEAINKTEEFFQQLGVATKLSHYQVTREKIPMVINQLKRHNMIKLGERGNVTPEIAEKILLAQL